MRATKNSYTERSVHRIILLDASHENEYTKNGAANFENRIDATFQAPTVLHQKVAGCEVTLIFAQEENPDIQKNIIRILEHGMIQRMSTGGN